MLKESEKDPSNETWQQKWNAFAKTYSANVEAVTSVNAIKFLNGYTKENKVSLGSRFLETGCGSGVLAEHILKTNFGFSELTFIDLSSEMVSFTHQRVQPYLKDHNVTVKVENAETLSSLPKNHYDFVMSNWLLNVMDHPEKAVRSIQQVMKDDAVFLCTLPDELRQTAAFKLLMAPLKEVADFNIKPFSKPKKNISKESYIELLESEGMVIESLSEEVVHYKPSKDMARQFMSHPLLHDLAKSLDQNTLDKFYALFDSKMTSMNLWDKDLDFKCFNFVLRKKNKI